MRPTRQIFGKPRYLPVDEDHPVAPVDVNGIKVLAAKLDGADAKTLRDTMDKLKDKLNCASRS